MIVSLHQVRVDSNLSLGCVSKYKHTHLSNARGALLSLLILAFACLGSVKADAQNWTGSTVEAAKNKTVYLWNVGAKKFLGKGGRWGTEAIISNVGTPFMVVANTSSSTYRLESIVKGEGETSANGALSFMNYKNSTHDAGNYFVDRNSGDDTYGTRAFTFDGDISGYQLKVTSTGSDSTYYNGTFILFANTTTGKAEGVKSETSNYSKWIIVTEDERKLYFEKAEANNTTSVPGTFLMFDNGFDRNDNNVSKWQTKSSKDASGFDGVLSWSNNTKEVKPSDSNTYTYTYTGSHTYTYWYKTYTHNVTYTVTTTTPPSEQANTLEISCGKSTTNATYVHTAQTVTVSLDPSKTTYSTYYNGNGYSKDEVKVKEDEDGVALDSETAQQELYGGDWTANIHGSYGVVNQTIPNANMVREGWYKVSCVGFTTEPITDEGNTAKVVLYASAGTAKEIGKYYAEQPLKNIDPDQAPKTYVKASKLINGGGYEASVMVYVDKNAADAYKTLSFGILVDGAVSTAWTCFDNFQIEYFGDPKANLVLDENQTDVKYINDQRYVKNATGSNEEYKEQRTLYLHRTFNAGKWNSIVLPVTLTVSQVKSAFGENVRISEFKGAIDETHKGRIIFQKINVDRNNDSEIAIEAGKLYLIKPDDGAKMDSKEGDVTSTSDANIKVSEYYTIPQVQFYPGKNFDAKVKGEIGKETYDGNVNVQFVGTYVSDNKGGSIPANSYVLSGKDTENFVAGLWYYRTVPTNTKGFRGWLQPVGNNSSAKQLEYSVDGVVGSTDYTTGIQGIVDDLNAKESNIYNLNGQLVRANATSHDGLAKGVYIQNGKKFIVK